jgi:hypothetical protein
MINAGITAGVSVEEQRRDPVQWQMELLQKDFQLFDRLAEQDEVVLTDTSFVEHGNRFRSTCFAGGSTMLADRTHRLVRSTDTPVVIPALIIFMRSNRTRLCLLTA